MTTYNVRPTITKNYGARPNASYYLWSDKIQPWRSDFHPWLWRSPAIYTTRTPIT